MLLVPVRPSLSLTAYLTLLKALIQVKAHTRRDGTQVKAHTRNIQSKAERRELVEALAKKMAGGAHTRHATLASAVGAARFASRANGKAAHVYEHADGGWVATHDGTPTEGDSEKIVAHKGKARLHRAGEASRSLAHLKGPIVRYVEEPFVPKVKPARPKAEKKPAAAPRPKPEGPAYHEGVALADMPEQKPYKHDHVVHIADSSGNPWHRDSFMASRGAVDPLAVSPGANEVDRRTHGDVDAFLKQVENEQFGPPEAREPVGYMQLRGNQGKKVARRLPRGNFSDDTIKPHQLNAVVFDNGAAVNASLYQHLKKLHPEARWVQAQMDPGRDQRISDPRHMPMLLQDAAGQTVAVAMPMSVKEYDWNAHQTTSTPLQAFSDKVAAGHRPASIKPEKPGYEGPEGKDMTDDNAAERKAARDLRAAVADKTGAVAKARVRLGEDVADIYAVKHPEGHITATVHWVKGQKAFRQPPNSFALEGGTRRWRRGPWRGPRKWDTITAFKRHVDALFKLGAGHQNWKDAHYESKLAVGDFSEEHAKAVETIAQRRKMAAASDALAKDQTPRRQAMLAKMAEEQARQEALVAGDRSDLKHPATRKAVVDELKKLDVHTLAPRARWNSIDPDVVGKQLNVSVQINREVPRMRQQLDPWSGEPSGPVWEDPHDNYRIQWHPDRGVSIKDLYDKKVWSDPTAKTDPVAAMKVALQAANALPDMVYKN